MAEQMPADPAETRVKADYVRLFLQAVLNLFLAHIVFFGSILLVNGLGHARIHFYWLFFAIAVSVVTWMTIKLVGTKPALVVVLCIAIGTVPLLLPTIGLTGSSGCGQCY